MFQNHGRRAVRDCWKTGRRRLGHAGGGWTEISSHHMVGAGWRGFLKDGGGRSHLQGGEGALGDLKRAGDKERRGRTSEDRRQ